MLYFSQAKKKVGKNGIQPPRALTAIRRTPSPLGISSRLAANGVHCGSHSPGGRLFGVEISLIRHPCALFSITVFHHRRGFGALNYESNPSRWPPWWQGDQHASQAPVVCRVNFSFSSKSVESGCTCAHRGKGLPKTEPEKVGPK